MSVRLQYNMGLSVSPSLWMWQTDMSLSSCSDVIIKWMVKVANFRTLSLSAVGGQPVWWWWNTSVLSWSVMVYPAGARLQQMSSVLSSPSLCCGPSENLKGYFTTPARNTLLHVIPKHNKQLLHKITTGSILIAFSNMNMIKYSLDHLKK